TTANSAENTGVSSGVAYTYEVVARNTTGQTTAPSPTATATAGATTLFSDNFDGTTPTTSWTMVGAPGAWQFNETASDSTAPNGVLTPANSLSQTHTSSSGTTTYDPQKAIVTPAAGNPSVTTNASSTVMVTARFAITSWTDGEYARVGMSLFTGSNGK